MMLHKYLIKEKYDIEVAYLEGPCARIVSGCPWDDTKEFAWIHIEQHTPEKQQLLLEIYLRQKKCYNKFNCINCVSEYVRKDFL